MNIAKLKPNWRVILIVLAVIAAVGRRYFNGLPSKMLAVGALCLFIVKLVQWIAASRRRILCVYHRSGVGYHMWKEVFPPWLRGLALTEALIYLEVICRSLRIKAPSSRRAEREPNGAAFALAQGNISTLLVPLAIIGLVADIPLSQVVIAIWNPRFVILIHTVTLLLAAWGLVWILGDRFAVKTLKHVVNSELLTFQVGFRWSCEIPIEAVRNCSPLKGRPREWKAMLRLEKNDVWCVTPIDHPNVLVEVDPAVAGDFSVIRMGAVVTPKRYFAVYVDSPGAFISEISEMIGSHQGLRKYG